MGKRRKPKKRPYRQITALAVAVAAVAATPLVTDVVRGGGSTADGLRDAEAKASRSSDRVFPATVQEATGGPELDGGVAVTRKSIDPASVKVPQYASGKLVPVPGGARPTATRGRLMRYRVLVEKGLPLDGTEFARTSVRVLNDPRSWAHGGAYRFEWVTKGPVDFELILASPRLTDLQCRQGYLDTDGLYSCRVRDHVVINAMRWAQGAEAYQGRLAEYRIYVINHEVGHRLGHKHEGCPGPGRLAPVMMQQTKGVGECRPNPWPYP
ncbi:DUF3152 domain-containing protein [Carbonactinospora thermoautotrophica]|uniref:DUF3152 domain-containing protein n=1 Tax=Carbonactinospora thermoautotrophica TaxID=1469144 RepID=UPI00226F8619|nr:DUF3152 domain-containing protein [Carbonactinospora thermoautotrophica]